MLSFPASMRNGAIRGKGRRQLVPRRYEMEERAQLGWCNPPWELTDDLILKSSRGRRRRWSPRSG
eukprot:scaffold3098_cov29-Prasinocladus_malaysianus.AAC.1